MTLLLGKNIPLANRKIQGTVLHIGYTSLKLSYVRSTQYIHQYVRSAKRAKFASTVCCNVKVPTLRQLDFIINSLTFTGLCVCFVQRASPGLGWNGRVGRQSRLSSGSSTTEEDGIFVNSASSKLLERAHDILMSVTRHIHSHPIMLI